MYTYRYRPGYGSDQMIIEFDVMELTRTFYRRVLEALAPLDVKRGKKINLWNNSDVVYPFRCSTGTFELSADEDHGVFLLAPYSQDTVEEINELLQRSPYFKKEDVDFEQYRI